jgi:2-methylisocitrate lyase-like PEP mutase family enzyme
MPSERSKASRLRELHHGRRALVLVNVWDVASAVVVERAGLPAIATSSSAVAAALGYPDGERIPPEEMLDAVARIAQSVAIPVTADMEAGYGGAPGDLRALASRLIEAGLVGLNLEDGRDPANGGGLADPLRAEERIRAVRAAGEASGVPIVINARTDVFLATRDHDQVALRSAIERLARYRDAGADCLYPIGLRDPALIAVLVRELDFPINVLAGPGGPTVRDLETLGVARISLGGAPQRAALGALARVAAELADTGTYRALEEGIGGGDLDALIEAAWRRRTGR